MAAPEQYPNLTNAGNGRKPGSKNYLTTYTEELIKKHIVDKNLLIKWIDKLDEKIDTDSIRPEAIAPAIEKVAKYIVRTAADQEILDTLNPVTEDDITKDIEDLKLSADLLVSLMSK
ncbi:hypothetical protein G7D34_003715 [Salmonella enterica]|nr:hypothetical protein [Salmonella enterica]